MKQAIVAILFVLLSYAPYAQNSNNRTIDVNTDVDITVVYEQVVKEGYGTSFIYKELAIAYYFKSNYPKAKEWFEKLFEVEKSDDETLNFRYTQTLKALKANEWSTELSALEDPD